MIGLISIGTRVDGARVQTATITDVNDENELYYTRHGHIIILCISFISERSGMM